MFLRGFWHPPDSSSLEFPQSNEQKPCQSENPFGMTLSSATLAECVGWESGGIVCLYGDWRCHANFVLHRLHLFSCCFLMSIKRLLTKSVSILSRMVECSIASSIEAVSCSNISTISSYSYLWLRMSSRNWRSHVRSANLLRLNNVYAYIQVFVK